MSQGPNRPPFQQARTYPEICGPYHDRQDDRNPPRTPRIPTVSLPEEVQDASKNFPCSYSESNPGLGGGLMVKLGGDPETTVTTVTSVGYLDAIFPELFAVEVEY